MSWLHNAVGMAVHLDRETACSHFHGAARLARSLTIGTVQNDLRDTGCIGIRSEKAIVQSIRQKWASKCISEQSAALSVPLWPSRVEQSTMSSWLLRHSPAATAHWLTVCIKRQGMDFCKNYLFRTVYKNSVYWKEIPLTAVTQWAVKIPLFQIVKMNYQKLLHLVLIIRNAEWTIRVSFHFLSKTSQNVYNFITKICKSLDCLSSKNTQIVFWFFLHTGGLWGSI